MVVVVVLVLRLSFVFSVKQRCMQPLIEEHHSSTSRPVCQRLNVLVQQVRTNLVHTVTAGGCGCGCAVGVAVVVRFFINK